MKLSNLLLFAGSAVGSYLLVKNREVITEEVLDTTDRVEAIKDVLDIIQNSLQIINQQKEVIKEYQEDLTYKFKVFEKENVSMSSLKNIASDFSQETKLFSENC